MSTAPKSLNNMKAFWMPFTANRQFKQAPRMFVGAKDMHYTTDDGRKVLDGTAGLWCCNAGHCRAEDHRGDPGAGGASWTMRRRSRWAIRRRFELANRLVDIAPEGMEHVVLHQLRLGIGRDGAEDGASPISARGARARGPG